MKWISNNLYMLASIVIAFFGVFIPWIQSKKKTKLSYNYQIINVLPSSKTILKIKNDLKISYNKKSVKDIAVMKLVITNEGKIPAKNFNPIEIVLSNAKIISYYIDLDNTTNGLDNINYKLLNNIISVHIPKDNYLNYNDKLTIVIIYEPEDSIFIDLKCRCEGCSKIIKNDLIKQRKKREKYFLMTYIIMVIITLGFTISTSVYAYKQSKKSEKLFHEYNNKYIDFNSNYSKLSNIEKKVKCKKIIDDIHNNALWHILPHNKQDKYKK